MESDRERTETCSDNMLYRLHIEIYGNGRCAYINCPTFNDLSEYILNEEEILNDLASDSAATYSLIACVMERDDNTILFRKPIGWLRNSTLSDSLPAVYNFIQSGNNGKQIEEPVPEDDIPF